MLKSCGICIRELSYRLKRQQLVTNTMWWRPAGTTSAICKLDLHHSYQPMKFTISTTTKPVPVHCTLHHQTKHVCWEMGWGRGAGCHTNARHYKSYKREREPSSTCTSDQQDEPSNCNHSPLWICLIYFRTSKW